MLLSHKSDVGGKHPQVRISVRFSFSVFSDVFATLLSTVGFGRDTLVHTDITGVFEVKLSTCTNIVSLFRLRRSRRKHALMRNGRSRSGSTSECVDVWKL